MNLVVGQKYILTNVMEGYYGGCEDIVKLDGKIVTVEDIAEYENFFELGADYVISDDDGEMHYVEAVNLKEIE
jgi:hypothetical protein